jgi:nuclease HARBI1
MFQIKDQLEYDSNRGQGLSPVNQLLLALRFYATGTFQLVVGDTFDIHKSTVCRTLHKVTAAIASLRAKYVKLPTTAQDRRDIMNSFYLASGLPGVVGAIDCTHIPIQSPGGNDAEIYRNRKGYFSINVQLTCDNTGYILDVVARWPGSVHDSTIFDNSYIRAHLETSPADGYLVGDGGYACRRYLLTPVYNPTTQPEKKYNVAQIKARNCIERTNGILKRRFPALKYGMRLTLEHTLPVIVATVVLHNIAVIMGDDVPPDDEELSTFIAQLRQQGLQVDYDAVDVVPPVNGINNPGATGMRNAVINSHFI